MKTILSLLMATCLLGLSQLAPAAEKTDKLDEAIDKLLQGKGQWSEAMIRVSWAGAVFGRGQGRSAVVYGRGLGIWKRSTQFKLSKKELQSLLKLVKESKFDTMKKSYGGNPRGGRIRGAPEFLQGQVSLTIGSVTKSVTQLGGGEQSQELKKLATGLLDVCEKAAKNNPVTAASLGEGLKKLSKEELLPETFSVLVHRVIQKRDNAPKEEGFLLRINGRTVTTRRRITGKGIGPEHRLELTPKQFQAILKVIAENEPEKFPVNMWAKFYTDFNVNLLQHRKSMQARQFARLTPQTHGEKQKQFDRIFARMQKLHQQVLKEGKKVEPMQR